MKHVRFNPLAERELWRTPSSTTKGRNRAWVQSSSKKCGMRHSSWQSTQKQRRRFGGPFIASSCRGFPLCCTDLWKRVTSGFWRWHITSGSQSTGLVAHDETLLMPSPNEALQATRPQVCSHRSRYSRAARRIQHPVVGRVA
jgi:hypothetical protein